jgi:beta-galactosidase/beta-glucuronidase
MSPNQGTIVVPFPIGSTLSQVLTPLKKHEEFIYTKKFTLPDKFIEDITYLHIDGADQFAKIMLNGVEVGTTDNAYIPKHFDVSSLIKQENKLELHITDPLDEYYPYGKQSRHPGGIWYTATSGLWKSVWLESVPKLHLRNLTITPDVDNELVHFDFDTDAPNIEVTLKNIPSVTYHITTKAWNLKLDEVIYWTPDHPYCYDVEIKCGDDIITTYFAMRKISIMMHKDHPVIALNNEPPLLSGVLDQGYYSDGLLTPASYECYEQDIREMKAMGFNILRKHIKIEPLRFYYECDRLGMLVWQDMVNNGSYDFFKHTARPMLGMGTVSDTVKPQTQPYLDIFQKAMQETVALLYNSPSIGLWTIYNEGWGQIEADKMAQALRQYDPTRIVDATSGWFHQSDSDVDSLHIYFKKITINQLLVRWY